MAALMKHVRCLHHNIKPIACQTKIIFQIGPSLSLHTHVHTGGSRQRFLKSCFKRQPYLCTAHLVRLNSSGAGEVPIDVGQSVTDYIPPPPEIPQVPEIVETLNALGEPTLASMGLGGWYPPGIVQHGLEALHVGIGLPWWGSIVLGTVFVRLCMFPLVIAAQRNAAKMNNHMPTIQRLQAKMTEARTSGNPLEVARAGHELYDYTKRNEINLGKSFLVPIAQVPVFLSVFIGLRRMASLPVESMKDGGIFWFTDLTMPDPFYAMPLLTMGTFLATIELGVDGMKSASMTHTMKWVMRIMPVIMLPFISNFPAAMLCYWFTSNFFSLLQVAFLKIPNVRTFFKIPSLVKHDEAFKPKKKKFVEGFKDTWSNSVLMKEMEDRQRMDALKFKKAGQGPVPKTYSYDPTKTKGISAKSKS
ncbi:hypothetical protein ScPMuIL_000347 [Solemya velum]